MINYLIGGLLGYVVGITIWDKIILPVLEERRRNKERKRQLEYIEFCKIIGNPRNDYINL